MAQSGFQFMNQKHGFMNNLYKLDKKARTIKFPNLPPLVINHHYRQKDRRGTFDILRTIWIQQSTYRKKVILLDEIKLGKVKELRLRYYIIGKKGKRMYKKWTFGQFATFIPHKDFRKLIQLAKKYRMI